MTLPAPTLPPSHRRTGRAAALACAACLATTVLTSLAQYKVVDGEGRVTYTDRPPLAVGDKTSALKTTGPGATAAAAAAAALPVDVREAAQRYPVTLYSSANCAPCDAGRTFLQQRGIPYAEKSVINGDDSAMLLRLTGSSDVPVISIGAQVVRGWSSSGWASYLDAAGYPRESKLPASHPFAAATPLTEQRDTSKTDTSARLPSLLDDAKEVRRDPPPDPGGFRF